jgi:hypothetical protein
MSNHESDPREVAARYRVKKDEEGKFQICSEQGSLVNLRRQSIHLNFQTTLNAVRWYADPLEDAVYVIELLVAKLEIGYSGANGSPTNELIDNCFFGIDGEALKYLPLTKLNIMSEARLNTRESSSAASRGLEFIPKTEWDNGFGRGTIYYYHEDFDLYYNDEFDDLECRIGLPQAHFQQLLDGCLSERVSGVYFSGNGGALSSGIVNTYQPGPGGSVRDVILLANEEFDFRIKWLTLEYCGKQEVPMKPEEDIEEKPPSLSEIEKILMALEHVISGIGALRSTVIKTSWILVAALIIAALIK